MDGRDMEFWRAYLATLECQGRGRMRYKVMLLGAALFVVGFWVTFWLVVRSAR